MGAGTDRRMLPLLVEWFRVEKRELPWRERRDGYRVWISEAMLQQTRVSTVIPYYERFLARFPDVRALAEAQEEAVLAHWSGLGYYRRARTLQRAARWLVEQRGGVIPRTRAELLQLPGIGPYTAGAIASLAFDEAEPVVDGNVARVFARVFALRGAAGSPGLKRKAWDVAQRLVPRAGGAGEWNEALMELGALVCLPREPRCEECPWKGLCAARALGRAEEFPGPKARKAGVDVELVALLVERRGRVLLRQRAEDGRMAGLWELPTREVGSARLFESSWPVRRGRELLREGAEIGRMRHSITHHRIRLGLRRGELLSEVRGDGWRWVSLGKVSGMALTGMARKALRTSMTRPLRSAILRRQSRRRTPSSPTKSRS